MQFTTSGWGSGVATPKVANKVEATPTKKITTKQQLPVDVRPVAATNEKRETLLSQGEGAGRDNGKEASELRPSSSVSGGATEAANLIQPTRSIFGTNMLWLIVSVSLGLLAGFGARMFMQRRGD